MKRSNVQVPDGFYDFASYVTLNRWTSYWYQVKSVMKFGPRSVLEIGCGAGVTTHMLRSLGVEVTTFDFDAALEPDIVGDIRELESIIGGRRFDLVCAFQVLEHLPFDHFSSALSAMGRVASKNVVLSLPYWGYPIEVKARILKDRFAVSLARKLTRYPTWKFDGQHHWEMGTRGHSRRRVSALIAKELRISDEFFCEGNSYHYFYETEVNR